MSLLTMTLLVSGFYNLYVSIVWLSAYSTIMTSYVLYFICFLIFYLLVTYAMRPNYENEPIILYFIDIKSQMGSL